MVAKGESLLTPSAIKLYGRIIDGLTINVALDELGGNKFLLQQLKPPSGPPSALARIYGYSYLGRYTALARPAIFLVHGDGEPALPAAPESTSVDKSGQAFTCGDFSSDIKVWEYDRGDFSLRLDIDIGPLEQILIEVEEEPDDMPYFRGAHTRFRGAHTRFRGAHTRLRGSGE
jgi:hypothetical protein